MKKGDNVTINVIAVEVDKQKLKDLHLGSGLSLDHPFLSSSLHDKIIERAKAGKTPKITGIVDNYANLIFDDGFECGLDVNHLTLI